jgi:hypothetical protein
MDSSRCCFVLVCLAALALPAGAGEAPPHPPSISLADVPDPFWWPTHIFEGDPVALEFAVDLDLLAPLGSKPGNGAVWFSDFTKIIGPRRNEVERAEEAARTVVVHGKERAILPPGHPLLLEAEPHVDQAVWSFYPEVWPWQGGPTPIANLIFALQLGRSWVARGESADSPEGSAEDFRRTVRLGRLLLQDDVVYIQNLVGIALVRLGAEAIFNDARKRGDGATAALAALILQDCTALRLELTRRFQRLAVFEDFVARVVGPDGTGRTELRLPNARFDRLLAAATSEPCRALRIEAMVPLWITSRIGTESQRATALKALTALADDADGLVAAAAAEVLARSFDANALEARWAEPVAGK